MSQEKFSFIFHDAEEIIEQQILDKYKKIQQKNHVDFLNEAKKQKIQICDELLKAYLTCRKELFNNMENNEFVDTKTINVSIDTNFVNDYNVEKCKKLTNKILSDSKKNKININVRSCNRSECRSVDIYGKFGTYDQGCYKDNPSIVIYEN